MQTHADAARAAHAGKLSDIGSHITRVAHELAGPLSLIVGSLDALGQHASALVGYVEATTHCGADDAELRRLRRSLNIDYAAQSMRDLIEICREGTSRLEHVIRQLRSHGRYLGEPAAVSAVELPPVLHGAIRMVTATRPSTVEAEVGELPAVCGSKDLLGEVFVNLVANACDAVADRPEGRVRIVAEALAERGGLVVVRVCDNGPGIAWEDRERIFEPFFTTKASRSGLGLGLVIAREIVEALGGTLTLTALAPGAEFVVALPVHHPTL